MSLQQLRAGTQLLGGWTSWTPTWTGFSVNPTVTARYTQIGKTVFCSIDPISNGTSNSGTFTMSIPVTAISGGNGNIYTPMMVRDNGTNSLGAIYIPNGATSATFYKDITLNAFTASGNKLCFGFFFYEAA